MIISSDLYRQVVREGKREKERYSSAVILLLATELPAAVCHVYAAATQPRDDPGQRSIFSSSAMTPSREERVEQVMPVRVSLLGTVLILHGSRAGGDGFAQPSVCLGMYVAYRKRCARLVRMISPHASVEEATEIDRERSSVVVEAEIDFALVATDVPPINRCKQISGFGRVSASPDSIFIASCWLLRYRKRKIFFVKCIQSDVNIRRFLTEIMAKWISISHNLIVISLKCRRIEKILITIFNIIQNSLSIFYSLYNIFL